jgi:hypothetical protein
MKTYARDIAESTHALMVASRPAMFSVDQLEQFIAGVVFQCSLAAAGSDSAQSAVVAICALAGDELLAAVAAELKRESK